MGYAACEMAAACVGSVLLPQVNDLKQAEDSLPFAADAVFILHGRPERGYKVFGRTSWECVPPRTESVPRTYGASIDVY